MGFRRNLNWRVIGSLLALVGLGVISAVRLNASEEGASDIIPLTPANLEATTLTSQHRSERVQTQHDSTTVQDILKRSDLLEKMESWNGKALFVKVDETLSPPQLRYYYYNSLYQDANQNGVQDPGDIGFFNPASTVKVSLASLVLETLAELAVTRQAEYRVAGSNRWYRFEEDIRRTLVISDNEATNRLILWLGFDNINHRLAQKDLPQLTINRLMLDEGTLIPSPAFEMRFEGEITQRNAAPVSISPSCYETQEKVGNCATASDLLLGLMQIVHPEYFSSDGTGSLSEEDRAWLLSTMSRTPREEGFDYADDYCRFLTATENQIAATNGKMLSKCGVALFTNTYTDLSYIETDTGEEYYLLLSLSPPRRTREAQIFQYMNQVAETVLSTPL